VSLGLGKRAVTTMDGATVGAFARIHPAPAVELLHVDAGSDLLTELFAQAGQQRLLRVLLGRRLRHRPCWVMARRTARFQVTKRNGIAFLRGSHINLQVQVAPIVFWVFLLDDLADARKDIFPFVGPSA